jgi:hypothetical protein
MMTRFRFYRLALEADERQTNIRDVIAAQVIPAEQSLRGELPGRETNAASNITYE